MSRDATKPVFGVSDQVRHKLGCSAAEDGLRSEISDFESRELVLFMLKLSENKGTDGVRRESPHS